MIPISIDKYLKLLGITALLLLLVPGTSRAQNITADVLGTVTDSTGAIVPNAAVVIENLDTHETRNATTSPAGEYGFTLLPIGTYTLRVTAPGFSTFSQATLPLSAGDRRRVDAKLQIGAASERITVTGAPPALQTDDSTIGTTIGEQAVQDLPTNGRNFINLAQLVPGANSGTANSIASGSRPDDRRETSAVSVNGQSTMVNTEEIDGLDNNERIIGTIGVRPSIDAIQEFRVETNQYTAEVGRTAAAVINILTKSGTNTFHGSAYEFLRNDILDARDYFSTSGPKPEFRQNQFGGSIGGPIIRDKTFFFADFEGLRRVQGTTSTVTVPTLFEEQNPGNFSDAGGPVLTAAQLNPIALNYYKLYPTPTSSGFSNNFVSSPNDTQNAELADARIDEHFNQNNLFFARYSINRTNTNTPGPFPAVNGIEPGGNVYGEDGVSNQQEQNVALNYIHIFTPSVLLELKAGYTRINNASLPLNFGNSVSSQFGLTGANYSDPTSHFLTPFVPSGYGSVGDGEYLPLQDIDNVFQYNGSISINKGNHSMKMGATLIRRQATNIQSAFAAGAFNFNDNFAAGQVSAGTLGACNNPQADTCTLISMLEGVAFTAQRSNQLYPISYRTWEPSVYFQDNWRALPWLTLNLGVRYDLFTPYTEKHNRLSNLDPTTGTLILAGVGGVNNAAGVETDYSNFAPRFGFAATLPYKAVVRGGFGMSFFPDNYGTSGDRQNQPFVFNFQPAPEYNISQGLPVPSLDNSQIANPQGAIANAMDPSFRNAYMYQSSLTYEQQFGANVLTVTYVSDIGRHLAQFIPNIDVPLPSAQPYQDNCAPAGSAACTALPTLQSVRPFNGTLPGITSITQTYSHGVSYYNAGEIAFQRRISQGLTFNVNYTLAHMLDNAADLNQDNQAGYGLIPSLISTYDYGNSDADVRNRLAGSFNYDLPFGKSLTGYKKAIAGGWKTNGILVWQSGLPFTVQNNVPQINTGAGDDRPNLVGNPTLSHPNNTQYFNVAAFQPQAFGTAGDAPRNPLHGPHYRHFDFSAFKEFPVHKDLHLEFRTEIFNLTNTASFAVPNAALGTNGVGSVSGDAPYYTPREIQFALKLLF
ncbi:TonB-dependent receptor [Granulicella mallensis]|jgi:hypothetical protein|uniref:TonB-dependent transporter Oar-like beta-barrel domain-containing protein n=1 Tax=Granulicella mallensis TaxID=940614 RepID=A0A7W7ZL63_9BACT|nr:TonB-dependent receptor [Granulicella mallensis]MBB5061942.1 hypothetical protein [Granulicella mallensis]